MGGGSGIDGARDGLAELAEIESCLREVARVVGEGAGLDAVVPPFSRAEAAADRLLSADEPKDRRRAQDVVARCLEELEGAARACFQDTALPSDAVARRLAVLRASSRLLRRVTRRIESGGRRDETPFLLVELQDIENGLRPDDVEMRDGEEDQPDELRSDVEGALDGVSGLRLRVIREHAEAELELAADVVEVDEQSVMRDFRLTRALRRTGRDLDERRSHAGGAAARTLDELVGRVDAERERIEEKVLSFAARIDTPEQLELLAGAALWLTGELDEARIAAFDQTSPRLIADLDRLRVDAERFSRAFRAATRRVLDRSKADKLDRTKGGTPRDPLRKETRRAQRRLERMTRRIRNVVADRTLALRLDRVFGRRMVRIWEAIVFWLIVGVLGLIVVDHYRAPDPEGTIGWTIWVDTAICAILLLDFSVRLMLSPGRLRYLRRNFLTELAPSIPFGILAHLDKIPALRSLRTVRLVRVVRVLRIARPIIRIARLLLFIARAADRLVERNAWLLNQNIVFFTDPVKDETVPTLLKRARNLESWIARRTSTLFAELPIEDQVVSARWRTRLVEIHMEHDHHSHHGVVEARSAGGGHVRDLDVDDVVQTLRELDDKQVAELLGVDVARQLTSSLRLFRLPMLRRLPVVRFVLGPTGAPDPLWTTARLGRLAGDFLAWVQRTINWFADLYGTITGAQFLDRMGMQLIKATAQPAKRLALFGGLLLFVYFITLVLNVELLEGLVKGTVRFLSVPVIMLGAVCLVPLLLGVWFRRIAGQAADFFDRVAEAQFLALTEVTKELEGQVHLEYLTTRVLLPEARLRGDGVGEEVEATVARLAAREMEKPGSLMMLFYRDFVDGAFFHRNDTKIANMVLGNLTLENIRVNRLRWGTREAKRLDRLDIARGKGGLRGPYVWFNFITHSVAQHTARLIIEYNQHCIPADEVGAAHPRDRELFDSWLAKRKEISRARRAGRPPGSAAVAYVSGADGTLTYRSTEFNALHFLTKDERRDAVIRERYGPEVESLLQEDRENLIRDIFGTFPMHDLPKAKRTFNFYEAYRRYLSRGKIFFFPLIAAWLVLRAARILLGRTIEIIRDVLDPKERRLAMTSGRAGFDVARRKIHRMRRPVIMEAVRLRAAFDLPYLGLSLPGRDMTVEPGHLLVDDLRRLEASEREWEEFRNLKSERERQVRLLSAILRYAARRGRDLERDLRATGPSFEDKQGEALRAIATAFICDQDGLESLASAHHDLRDFLRRLPEQQRRRFRRLPVPVPKRRRMVPLVRAAWPLIAPQSDGDEKLEQRFTDAILHHRPELRRSLELLAAHVKAGGKDPFLKVYEDLLHVGHQPFGWTEQIIAVRTVQSLGMLDLSGYEKVIAELGSYEDVAERETAAPLF